MEKSERFETVRLWVGDDSYPGDSPNSKQQVRESSDAGLERDEQLLQHMPPDVPI